MSDLSTSSPTSAVPDPFATQPFTKPEGQSPLALLLSTSIIDRSAGASNN